jgi:hypothetical protein
MENGFVAFRRVAMLPRRPIFPPFCLSIALVLGGCAQPPPGTGTPSVEHRLSNLERRVENLEALPQVEPPYRNKEAIQADIKALEEERGKLLIRYTAQHPAIRDIDRRLAILDKQLKLLEQE